MKRLHTVLLLVATLAVGAAQAAPGPDVRTRAPAAKPDVTDPIKKSFKVRPGGTLYVDLDHGNVEVETTSKNAVLVLIERTVNVDDPDDAKRILDRHRYELEQTGDDVRVLSRYEEDEGLWGRWRKKGRLKISIKVQVPEAYNVSFKNGAGNVEIAELEGEVTGKTGAGNITIGAVEGPVDVKSGSGNIVVRGAIGRVEIRNGAGNIDLFDIEGRVSAATGAGNITAEITEQPEGDSELESGAGNITVILDDDIGLYVDAVASLGSATTDFPLKVEGQWMKKSFEGQINGGGPALKMRCGVGNVTLSKD